MNRKGFLAISFLAGAGLALGRRVLPGPAPSRPGSGGASYDAIGAYIEAQMRRLKIPAAPTVRREGSTP